MRWTCIVVEDEPDIAALIRLSLDPDRYEVALADTLAEGRRLLAPGRPADVVILDCVLPDGDGLDLCRDLRAAGRWTPVIVLTARAAARDAAAAAAADRFVLKPFDPDELQRMVDDLLGQP